MLAQTRYLPFAYKEQDASVYGVDLWSTYCYTIQGKTRSGRKNMLKLLAYAASKKENARVCIIDIDGQELKKFSEQHGLEYIGNESQSYEFFKSTIPLFKERNQKKRALLDSGMEEEEMIEIMNKESHVYIFITDMVAFVQSVYKVIEGVGSINAYLENISEKGSHHGFYFFSILNPDQASSVAGRQLYTNMISYKTGAHLGGNITAQRLFQFNNIPFQEQSKVTKPGKGLVPSFEVRAVILNQTFLIFKIASAANIQEESCPDVLDLRLKYIEVLLFKSLCLKVRDEITYQVYKSYDILGLF